MRFTEEQMEFAAINGVQLHDMMTGNEIVDAINVISDILLTHGFDKEYRVNEVGAYCESIIDILSEL